MRFTVFTPTFNRAHTLNRVFDSLCAQPYDLFEWLVIDDGSTDQTEVLLRQLSLTAPFPMRIVCQANGGKHRAHNVAVQLAQGELTIILDSDDELVPGALSILSSEWESIAPSVRESIAGILGHAVTPEKKVIGRRYPFKHLDGNLFELAASGIIAGDKLPCYRSDVLRRYPFPEKPGCNALVTEGVVWAKISERFQVRCIDSAVLIVHRDPQDPISLMNSHRSPASNAWGRVQYLMVVLNLSGKYLPRFFLLFMKSSVNLTRCSLHSGSGILYPTFHLHGRTARVLWLFGLPLGLVVWLVDRLRTLCR